jgi:hypothetical protein
MGQRAAELVRQEFNLGITVNRYAALYGELMDRRIRNAGNRAQGEMPAPTRRQSLPERL